MNRSEQLTRNLAAHLRDPARHPAPDGIEDRRLQIYRDLFIGNVRRLLRSKFPVAAKILGDKAFAILVRQYYAEHASHTPYFPELGGEVLRFIEERPEYWAERWPFLYELMHYEWVERALAISVEEIDQPAAGGEIDLLDGVPLISPLARRLAYHFPVEKLSPDYQPSEAPAEPTFLVVWRDRCDKVRFLKLNPVAAQLLNIVAERTGQSGREHLLAIAAELRSSDVESVVQFGLAMLKDWHERDIVVGCTPSLDPNGVRSP